MSLPVIGMLPQPHKQGNFYGENNPAISFYHNIQRNNTPQNNSDNRYSNMYGNTTFEDLHSYNPDTIAYTTDPGNRYDSKIREIGETEQKLKDGMQKLADQQAKMHKKNENYIKELGSLMEKLMGNMEKEKETGNIFKDFGQGFLKGKENVRAGNTTRFGGFFERLINPNKSYDDTGNSKNLNNTTSNPPQWI